METPSPLPKSRCRKICFTIVVTFRFCFVYYVVYVQFLTILLQGLYWRIKPAENHSTLSVTHVHQIVHTYLHRVNACRGLPGQRQKTTLCVVVVPCNIAR